MGTARVQYEPIGVIHSEHAKAEETPIQPAFSRGCKGTAEVFPQFEEGLRDIEGFSHLIMLYHLHLAREVSLVVTPFLEDRSRGIFATRYPCRPNPIGMSVVRLAGREGARLFLEDIDILDGTPLLDIKPFVPKFDAPFGARSGWHDAIDPKIARQRGRRGYRGGRGAPDGRKGKRKQ